ncbi:sporulation protein [Streptomyces sp. WAC 01529]|uniref:GerW family sporulation protein n=1 Tax=Streptomyces sp. WAC 01529 TaxID=2203205 RepID=UPI000F6D05DA|nr:spore germination protein GerW family protein [Streptomyces sp. WAC 01529]AZM56035.1 sporulation protein [Streptomyces sp. WAC 01529]
MTAPDETAPAHLPDHTTEDDAHRTQLERLVEEIGERTAGTVVFGDAVTAEGVTVIPVAESGCGFGLGPTPLPADGADASGALQIGGAGGFRARPRGFIEIKNGTATYRPLPHPWLTAALPLAAFLAGTAVPRLVRLLAQRRAGR